MAAVNSLLLLLSTIAPNTEPPGNSPITYPYEWTAESYYPTDLPITKSRQLPDLECRSDEVKSCFSHCQLNCTNYNTAIACPMICVPGCVCRFPMVRRPDGACIMPEECQDVQNYPQFAKSRQLPDLECRSDEVKSCFSHCQLNCTNYNTAIACPMICDAGCVCRYPMVRRPDGACILPEECQDVQNYPQVAKSRQLPDIECRSDEEKSCFSHCQLNCTNYNTDIACPMICVEGCVCKLPMVRRPDGACIMPEECQDVQNHPLVLKQEDPSYIPCPDNEEVSCFSHCQPNCTNYDKEITCPMYCVEGCVCSLPLIRGPEGNCISSQQCPTLQTYTTDNPCSDWEECDKKDIEIRNKDENDILSEIYFKHSSPRDRCAENEEFQECGNVCQKNCRNYTENMPCEFKCESGCFCKEPMIRGPDGKCIYEEDCSESMTKLRRPQDTCPENEEFQECGNVCETNCREYSENMPCEFKCESGCFCKDPMVRGPDGRCIYKEQCPESMTKLRQFHVCPPNEQFQFCGTLCPTNCTTYGKDVPCIEMCVGGCFCIEPRIRGPFGKCILPDECPVASDDPEMSAVDLTLFPDLPQFSCKENAEFSLCASLCPDTCENYETNRICKHLCIPGCRCKDGYVKGREGMCIKKENCAERLPEDCAEFEYYDDCGTQCEKDCYNFNTTESGCEDKECKKGCFCKPGLVRSQDWKCVHPDSCPLQSRPRPYWTLRILESMEKQENIAFGQSYLPDLPKFICKENAEFSLGASLCPDNCDNYQTDRICSHISIPGCKCKEGFVIGRDGTCIKKEYCEEKTPEDCKEYEYYDDCGSNCETDCYNYNSTDSNCQYKECKKGCFCKPGLVRSPEWKCIRPDSCPLLPHANWTVRVLQKQENSAPGLHYFPDLPKLSCKENSEFSLCASMCPDNCDNYETDRICKHLCVPGCQCNEGYVVGRDGTCVKKEHCEIQTPENCTGLEYYDDCGSYCEMDCYNYNTDLRCESQRCKKGCFCKTGFVRSPDWKCILPELCPPQSKLPLYWSLRMWEKGHKKMM